MSKSKKILFPILTFFIFCAGLEISMRLLGWIHHFHQTWVSSAQPEAKIVMTLGESTTANNLFGSWPSSMQESFKTKNLPIQVINESFPGTTSFLISKRLPDLIEKYNPRIVITMMGANDAFGSKAGPIASTNPLLNLRIAKLIRLGLSYFASPLQKQRQSCVSVPSSPKLIDLIRKNQITEAQKLLDQELLGKDLVTKASFFFQLNTDLYFKMDYGNPLARRTAYHFLKQSAEFAPEFGYGHLVLFEAAGFHDVETCQAIGKRILQDYGVATDQELNTLAACLKEEDPVLKQLLAAANRETVSTEQVNTHESYQGFYKEIQRSGICWVVMQYPNLGIDKLKNYFTSEQLKNPRLLFVENKDNFIYQNWDDVFIDHFNDDFGHTNDRGHQLIADQVRPVVENLLASDLCRQ